MACSTRQTCTHPACLAAHLLLQRSTKPAPETALYLSGLLRLSNPLVAIPENKGKIAANSQTHPHEDKSHGRTG